MFSRTLPAPSSALLLFAEEKMPSNGSRWTLGADGLWEQMLWKQPRAKLVLGEKDPDEAQH